MNAFHSAAAIAGRLLLAAAWLMPAWAQAQALKLSLPYRSGAAMQTAVTIIDFEASALVSPGPPTVTFDGTTLNVPDASCVGVACLSAATNARGDDVQLQRIGMRVRLTVTYSSAFSTPYCVSTLTAAGRTYDLTLTGFGLSAIGDGYRITSLMPASTTNCGSGVTPYVRVSGPRPALSAAPGNTLPKYLGRLPLNVVMVLDKSPSMQWTIPGSADIRWDRLKESAILFANVWDAVGAPFMGHTLSEGHPEDRLGLVFFGGSAVDNPLGGGGSFFKQRNADATPWGPGVTSALVDTFINATSIGAGAAEGQIQLDTVDKLSGDTATVLFTDGEQNTPPCVLHNGEVPTPTSVPYPGVPGLTYTDSCAVAAPIAAPLVLNTKVLGLDLLPRGPIYTIGLGEGGMAAGAKLLDEISNQSAGRPRFPNDGPSMDASFVDSLVDNLKGGTVSLMERVRAQVDPGAPAGAPLQVAADPSIARVVFVLSWNGKDREVRLEVRKPDGTVATPSQMSSGPHSRVVAVNLPSDGPAGAWQARVVRGSGVGSALPYQLSAYAVETRFSSHVGLEPRAGTGNPIRVGVEVGWDSAALAGLPAGAIRARLETPGENLGNALRSGANAPRRSGAPDDMSPLAIKIDNLALNSGLLSRTEPAPGGASVALADAGDGRYEVSLPAAQVGGKFRIRLDFDWNDPRTGPIHRVEYIDRNVSVAPTSGGTSISVSRSREERFVVLMITPRDSLGNYVGPGHGRSLGVTSTSGTVVLPASDPDLTGSYQVRINGLAPSDDPVVQIQFDGQTIGNGSLSGLGGGAGGGGSSRYSLWLAFGRTYPQGSFGNGYDSDFSGALGFEYAFTPDYSVEAVLAGHRFKGKGGAPKLDATQFGVNAKWYFMPAPLRPFATLGLGAYAFDPGSTRFGANAGLGLQFDVNPQLALEGRYGFHAVSGNAPNSRFSTLLLGARFSF